MAKKEKFTPIKDEELAKLTEEEKLQALGGTHLQWMMHFQKQVDTAMHAGFKAAIDAGLPLSDVVVVLADRRDKFFETFWTEEVKTFEHNVNAWWVFKSTLRAMPIYDNASHEYNGIWTQACSMSKFGLNCLVIVGTAASVQFIQPIPEKPDNANDDDTDEAEAT